MVLFGQTGILLRVVATCGLPLVRNEEMGQSWLSMYVSKRIFFCLFWTLFWRTYVPAMFVCQLANSQRGIA